MNQYVQRTVPGVKELSGTALADASVTVNGLPADRHGPWWRHALEVDNASAAAYTQAVVTAVYNPPGTNDPDVVTSQTGRVFVAQTPEGFAYDDDGNLLSDGRRQYTWNGENRLIKAEEQVSPSNRQPYTVEYAYDHQGRMVWKQVSTNAVVLSTRTIIWDGYNIVRALTHSQTHTLTNAFVWGLYLSGTLQGAGGVGGLLAEVKDGVAYTPAFDANGNVTEYADDSGNIVAHYEYSPFGELAVQSGPMTDAFAHRFSTEYWDAEAGLYYYGSRFYSSKQGRWTVRDSIGIKGGVNLYEFCGNKPVSFVDVHGLSGWSFDSHATPIYEELPIDDPRNGRNGYGMDVIVSYEMDGKERKCCKRVMVTRWVKKLFGMFAGTSGDYCFDAGMDDVLASAKSTRGKAPNDNPQGWSLFGYRVGLTQRFKWEAICIEGPMAGTVLSTIEGEYYSEGHFEGNDFNGYFTTIDLPYPDSSKYTRAYN